MKKITEIKEINYDELKVKDLHNLVFKDKDHDMNLWQKADLVTYDENECLYVTNIGSYEQIGLEIERYPNEVPEGVDPLPANCAYIGYIEAQEKTYEALYSWVDDGTGWISDNFGGYKSLKYAVDCTSEFAREKFPELVTAMELWPEFRVGDLVEVIRGFHMGYRGTITRVDHAESIYIIDSGYGFSKQYLKSWTPGYGYTTKGKLLEAPEGYEIIPEGEELPNEFYFMNDLCELSDVRYKEYYIHSRVLNCLAGLTTPGGGIRVYLKKVNQIAEPGEIWEIDTSNSDNGESAGPFIVGVENHNMYLQVHEVEQFDMEVSTENGYIRHAKSLQEYYNSESL